ncbi:MAG: septal ring lytic transglycosylase RlpA family protein [Saprospiraceae bacterium]|nr:septal ring lytic transglycosylase RlpA family protein [Saprospiraceae bacterium]
MRQTIFAFSCLCTLLLSAVSLSSFAQKTRVEYGKCGYYADSFQGRPTSNGEKYDKNALTCSHKTLPFGTQIRITRMDNKKTVVVRVNDRGPFIEGYVVDVSRAAAEVLDLIQAGTARVKIEVMDDLKNESQGATQLLISHKEEKKAETETAPVTYSTSTQKSGETNKAAASSGDTKASAELYKVDIKETDKKGYGIQVSALSDANNVLPIINKLQQQMPGKVLVCVVRDEQEQPQNYKIIIGPYPNQKAAEAQQKTVQKKGGFKNSLIVNLDEL